MDDNAPITCKEFIIAFARCLGYGMQDGVAEVLEKRASEYRRIGKLFGMEKVQPTFQWTKFWLSFLATGLAFVTLPIAGILHRLHGGQSAEDMPIHSEQGPGTNSRWRRGFHNKSLYDILRMSQWLPHPFSTFDALQRYLMAQWLPCISALALYVIFQDSMLHVSLMEVLYPLGVYMVIGMYHATISGYEHPKLQLRRINTTLSWEFKHNELQAVFAFRAHTPEGHAVDQINFIADVLFASQFKTLTYYAAALAGVIHGMVPVIHRVMQAIETKRLAKEMSALYDDEPTCAVDDDDLKYQWMTEVYEWMCGGREWLHLVVSVPSMIISGYLTYRLLYVTSAGFHNDLNFYFKLTLFRAATQAEPFLRYRARWLRARPATGRNEFLQFLNLHKRDDLLLWCRIRHLLVESYAGFKSKQGDIIVSYLLASVLIYACYIFLGPSLLGRNTEQLSVFDMRVRFDVFAFSGLLILIINLKLSIHSLRTSDIQLLHKEYYFVSMSESDKPATEPGRRPRRGSPMLPIPEHPESGEGSETRSHYSGTRGSAQGSLRGAGSSRHYFDEPLYGHNGRTRSTGSETRDRLRDRPQTLRSRSSSRASRSSTSSRSLHTKRQPPDIGTLPPGGDRVGGLYPPEDMPWDQEGGWMRGGSGGEPREGSFTGSDPGGGSYERGSLPNSVLSDAALNRQT